MGLFDFLKKSNPNTTINTINSEKETVINNFTINKASIQKNYQKTIFLYSQRKSKVRNNENYPRYLIYHAEITNPKKYHEKMIKEGYLEHASINDILDTLKVDELKKLLENYGLKKTGKKKDLINRLLENKYNELISNLYKKNKLYVLSKKGNDFLNIHDDYLKLFKNQSWNITVFEYEEVKNKLNYEANYSDVVWNIFNSRLFNNDIWYVRNTYYHMYELLMQENKKERAFDYLLIVFYHDLNVISSNEMIKTYLEKNKYNIYTKKDLIEYQKNITISTDIVAKLIFLEKYYKEEMVDKIYEAYKLPINCCPCDLYKKIMYDIYNTSSLDKEYYQKQIRKNYVKFVKSL